MLHSQAREMQVRHLLAVGFNGTLSTNDHKLCLRTFFIISDIWYCILVKALLF